MCRVKAKPSATKEIRYRCVRKTKYGCNCAKIRDPWRKPYVWLGTFDTAEQAAQAYDATATSYRGNNAITNFPIPYNAANSVVEASRVAVGSSSTVVSRVPVATSIPAIVGEDRHNDFDASSVDVDDDEEDCVITSSFRKPLNIDLNFPPPPNFNDDEEIRATTLRLSLPS
ncbi:putative transcription factor AP2-EREBP family [Medicago truncatula]|uniref:AP2 domain class transcription factor n=1 Tax=Medicago truncatula TaxID=3880 RepID=A0A072UFW7_MEDTR|nr:ethylene-responsive transcription factor 3 [Medicago truncatula]KEH28311.1 AP2 domain class transcription factor [Medicago truncatula]RHN57298.1 putative transcription factor AP2-EREBP family [Medicago truncatula]